MLGRRRARLIAITYVLIGVAIVGPNDVLIPLLKDHIGVCAISSVAWHRGGSRRWRDRGYYAPSLLYAQSCKNCC